MNNNIYKKVFLLLLSLILILQENTHAQNDEDKGPIAVGSYSPNGFGLYDMAGNVNEWVADWYDEDYYKVSPDKNPKGPKKGKFKVFRGGGWHSGPGCINVFRRNALPSNWVDFNVGFRCVKKIK